jgi:hypothetical protein
VEHYAKQNSDGGRGVMTDEKRMGTLGGLPQKIHIARGIKALVGSHSLPI